MDPDRAFFNIQDEQGSLLHSRYSALMRPADGAWPNIDL